MRPARRGFRRIFALIVAALAALACAKIVGDDKFRVVASLRDAGDSGVCAPGEFLCTGAALQLCRDDASGFRTVQVCSTPELCCDEASGECARVGCRVPACAAGDYRCRGELLELCNDGLTDWTTVDTCTSAVQCNATLGRCTDTPCNAAPQNPDFQCNGPVLEQCGATQWNASPPCESPSLCSAEPTGRGCADNGCLVQGSEGFELSGFECNNADLRRCNDGQTGFEYVETCVNAANCIAHLGVAAGELSTVQLAGLGCTAPTCVAGTYICDGATLRRCGSDRLRYREQEECASPSHCNASLGRCEAQPCVPGSRQCSANELWVCAPDQTWTTERVCESRTRCDVAAQGCVEKVCESGEYQCEGSLLERCNVDGSGWIPVNTCASSELCSAATKRCEPPVCEPAQRRCSREGVLQVCRPGLDGWQDEQNCPAVAVPPVALDSPLVASTCNPVTGCQTAPGCTPGTRRCNGQFLERCEENRWRPQQRCLTAALCDPSGTGSCGAAACQPGEYRCVMLGAVPVVFEPDTDVQGLTLERCNTGGTGFVVVKECAGTYCDAIHGQCDICDAYETLCEGDVLKRCSADGQEKELEKLCLEGCAARGDAGVVPATSPVACREDPVDSNAAK